MPASFGFHPAFAWPLPYGEPREEHRLVFEQAELSPVARLTREGLVAEQPLESLLIDGTTLPLDDDLFEAGAVIWPDVESASVLYGAPNGPVLEVVFPRTRLLGI